MKILGREITDMWVDEGGWATKPYKNRNRNALMFDILKKMEKKGFRYMEFPVMIDTLLYTMISDGFIKATSVHTKGLLIRGNFGVLITGREFLEMWDDFDGL